MADDLAKAIPQFVQAIPQLAKVPECAIPAYLAIGQAGCGPSLECICADDMFFFTITGVVATTCDPATAQSAIATTRSICIEAVPELDQTRGPEVVAAITVLTVLATIAVALRFLARHVARAQYGWDDWTMLFALLWEYGLSAVQYTAVAYGFGRHILLVNPDHVVPFIKLFFASPLIFYVAAVALKCSVLLFYHRIFPIRKFTVWNIAIGGVVAVWFIESILVQFFLCRPLAFNWDKTIQDGTCLDTIKTSYATSVPDIVTNVAILILPIPWLWNLQMQKRRKVAIICIFLLGS
ncbi:MAG: hypothetical protein Q9174_004369, partial [Haloplaca sp. 1 TL-2023]